MYNVYSAIATEFISHEEILESLDYARKNKNNFSLAKNILERAKNLKGLNHRDAITLLENKNKTLEQEIYITAEFPNATNHSEIEEAFNNLANRATQYANRKVG